MAATGSFKRRRAARKLTVSTRPAAPGSVASAQRRIGQLFAGRFRLMGLLGLGGMGVVYAARDELHQLPVAIKFLQSGPRRRPSHVARLKREGRVATRLQHPALVRTLGAGVHGGEPYVVLEFVPGARSLNELQRELPRLAKVRVIRDAAQALGHAHAEGVIHRDVKPDNILVDGRGRVRVVDFGLATSHESDPITREGDCLGTPLFLAPESIREGRFSPQVDVWALGVTLYWLLTGRYPFEAERLDELLHLVLNVRPTSPRCFDPEIPPRVERACLRALERDPRRRHPHGTALADDLDRWLLGEWARQSALRRRQRRPEARRHRSWLPAALGVTLALAGALAALEHLALR